MREGGKYFSKTEAAEGGAITRAVGGRRRAATAMDSGWQWSSKPLGVGVWVCGCVGVWVCVTIFI